MFGELTSENEEWEKLVEKVANHAALLIRDHPAFTVMDLEVGGLLQNAADFVLNGRYSYERRAVGDIQSASGSGAG